MTGFSAKALVGTTFLFFFASTASAATYHIDASRGNDTNPGTEAQPWKTLSKCGTTLVAGDTCVLHAGSYNASVMDGITPAAQWAKESGTADKPIVYRAAPGETVNMLGAVRRYTGVQLHYMHFIGFNFPDGGFHIQGVDSSTRAVGWRIEKCVINGGATRDDNPFDTSNVAGVSLTDADHITIIDNEIKNVSKEGGNRPGVLNGGCFKFYNTSNIVVENNYCHNSAKEGVGDKQGGSDNIYRRNIFENNGYEHIRISTQPDGVTGIWNNRAQIYENVFICPPSPNADLFAVILKSRASNAQIYNNTIYGCDGIGTHSDYDGTSSDVNAGTTFRDNIIVPLGPSETYVAFQKWDRNIPDTLNRNLYAGSAEFVRNRYCSSPPTDGDHVRYGTTSLSSWQSNTGRDTNSITGTVLFANIVAKDFHLLPGSAGIGAGTGGGNIGAFPRNDATVVGRLIGSVARPAAPTGISLQVVP